MGPNQAIRRDVPTRLLSPGDELSINDSRGAVADVVESLPRFPPRPLVYMTYSNALRVLPIERRRLTFVLVTAAQDIRAGNLASRITSRTGLRARTSADFKVDTVWWYLRNSEDVGDVEAMLSVAMLVGLGATGVMLFLFTQDNLRYYAMLKAMGASNRLLMVMIITQAGFRALIGTGIGVGLCAVGVIFAETAGIPFSMMWFTPLVGGAAVVLVTLVAATISIRPVLKLEPAMVFAAR